MASVGRILGGAFRLLREHPAAVVIWAVVYCAGSLIISLVMSYAMFGTPMPTDPAAVTQAQAWMGPVFGLVLLLYIGLLFLIVVLMNAVFRAVLRPEEGGFAFMRVGMDEFRMLGLVVLAGIAGFAAVLVGELLLLLVVAIIGFLTGQGIVTGIVAFLLFAAFFCALIWAEVRLSLIFPLTFHRRRISVDGAWDLTRGRFWLLFACYFLVGLIFIVASAIMIWATMSDYLIVIFQANGDQEQIRAAGEAFAAKQFGAPLVTKILLGVVGAVFFAAGLALGPGLLASATRELLAEGVDISVFEAESDGTIVD